MDEFLGSIVQFPYSFCPLGWAYCHGQLLNINGNEALFTLLGTTFGGDGIKTFALPDLRPKDANGNLLNIKVGSIYGGKVYMESFMCIEGTYPSAS